MRIPIKPLCEEKRIRNDGKAIIYLQYFHDGEHRVFLNTTLLIPPSFWDKRRECVKDSLPPEYGDYNILNAEVNRQLRLATDLINLAKERKIADPVGVVLAYARLGTDVDAIRQRVIALAKEITVDAR